MAKAKQAAAPVVDEEVDLNEGGGDDNDSMVVDLNSVEDGGFELIPKGVQTCTIEELDYAISQSKGNPMWSMTLVVADGEFEGRKLFSHLVWKGPGLPMTKRAVSVIAPELFEKPFSPKQVADEGTLLGRTVRVRVGHNKYEGETRNNVKGFLPLEDGETKFG